MVKISERMLMLMLLAGLLIGADLMLGAFLWFNVGPTPSQAGGLPVVNQPPTLRNVIVEWTTYTSGQDKFAPDLIVINQGDTVNLTFISNDTDAHTFSMVLPTGFFQINASGPGFTNPRTGKNFTTPASGCFLDGNTVPCNTKGKAGSLVATGMFSVKEPGIYEFTCVYHPAMFGYLVVMPNAGFKQSAAAISIATSGVSALRSHLFSFSLAGSFPFSALHNPHCERWSDPLLFS
jgi:plastocyanin